MKLLSRYLIIQLSAMSGLALFALLALYSFFDLLNEAGNIGKGTYTTWTAMKYMLMQMPAHAYQLMPLAVLIGGLLALSRLSSNSELAVIKTSGLSTGNIIVITLQFSVVFALFTVALGEWIAPKMSQQADAMKAAAKSGQVSTAKNGVWIRQRDSMILVSSMLPDHTLVDVKIWRYDADFKLLEAIKADRAQVKSEQWLLQGVHSSVLKKDAVEVIQQPKRLWISEVNNNLLDVLLVKPEQMSLLALTRYIAYLKNNNQQTNVYDVAWWNKLVYPIAVMVMSLVALAFTPVGSRHANMGLKLFGGICLGLLFFFSGRLFGFTTQLHGVPAFVSAVLPTAGFALWALWLIRKQERR